MPDSERQSEAHNVKIARFSFGVRSRSRTTSEGCWNAFAGCRRSRSAKLSSSFGVAFMDIPPGFAPLTAARTTCPAARNPVRRNRLVGLLADYRFPLEARARQPELGNRTGPPPQSLAAAPVPGRRARRA